MSDKQRGKIRKKFERCFTEEEQERIKQISKEVEKLLTGEEE